MQFMVGALAYMPSGCMKDTFKGKKKGEKALSRIPTCTTCLKLLSKRKIANGLLVFAEVRFCCIVTTMVKCVFWIHPKKLSVVHCADIYLYTHSHKIALKFMGYFLFVFLFF